MKVQTVKNRKLIWEFYTIDSEGNENIYSDWVGIKPARTTIMNCENWKFFQQTLTEEPWETMMI